MSGITTQTLTYTTPDGATMVSHLALPADTSHPVAGVIVAPEWWGVTDYPNRRAEELAALGYAALAIDVYGDGKTTTAASQANEWMTHMLQHQDMLMQRARTGLEQLAGLEQVDATRLAAIGYCFGGKIALDMAREGMPLKAVATFHGELSPKQPADPETFKADVMVEHGGDDSMVSMDKLEAFRQEMDKANIRYTVHVHDGAKHGFTNPAADQRAKDNGVDLGYNAQAEHASWHNLVDFLSKKLG